VAADGVLYFSSAGNEGNLGSGTSGVWEGDFVDSGTTLQGSPAHDFGGGAIGNVVSWDSPFFFVLQWSDPEGGSANDYDLFLLDSTLSSVVASSTDEQNGNDDPLELIDSRIVNDTGRNLVVVLYAGAPRYLHLNTFRGALGIATDGQIGGHTAAKGAISLAAVDVRSAAGPGGAFAGTESVQSYSSDGPRLVFYQPDGSPLTPSLLSGGGSLRAKPELAAADCVDTATPGFNTFCGTSAAAPHAAGIAAVLLELARARGQGSAEVREVLLGSALDIEAPGFDRDAGHGLADALAAAQALLLQPPNLPALGGPGLALLACLLALGALFTRGAGSAGPAAGRPRRRR
jgi:subtilisin family serine protease